MTLPLRHEGGEALAGGQRSLVTALIHREALCDHQGSVHGRAQRLHLLDTAGSGEESDVAQVP